MNPPPATQSVLHRILTSRLTRYPLYLLFLLTLLSPLLPTPSSPAATNPWRALPPDQTAALREVLFASTVLRDALLPTSVPHEDNYTHLSHLLRSLETRRDVSWTALRETGVGRVALAVANRAPGTFAPEPLDLHARLAALHAHWSALERAGDAPERWEVAHDTTFLPPLVVAEDGEGGEGAGLAAVLSEGQIAEMEARYGEWRAERDRKVAYLIGHPPQPMAWVPVSRREGELRKAWEELLGGSVVRAGQRVRESVLVRSPRWKPVYRDLLTERVPAAWRVPGEGEVTEEELEKLIERMRRESEVRAERTRKQEEVMARLKARREATTATEGGRDEL